MAVGCVPAHWICFIQRNIKVPNSFDQFQVWLWLKTQHPAYYLIELGHKEGSYLKFLHTCNRVSPLSLTSYGEAWPFRKSSRTSGSIISKSLQIFCGFAHLLPTLEYNPIWNIRGPIRAKAPELDDTIGQNLISGLIDFPPAPHETVIEKHIVQANRYPQYKARIPTSFDSFETREERSSGQAASWVMDTEYTLRSLRLYHECLRKGHILVAFPCCWQRQRDWL